MSAVVRQADLAFQANLYQSSNPTRAWLHNLRYAWIVRTLATLPLPPDATGLDVGIGCGRYSRLLLGRCGRVFAIDINPAFVAAVGDHPTLHAQVADIQSWTSPLPADVAICSEVVEHLEDPAAAMARLAESVRAGGYLILTTPHRWSTTELAARLLKVPGMAQIARRIYREPVDQLGHISLQSRRSLCRLVRAAGFRPVAAADLGLYLPLIAEFGGFAGRRLLGSIAKRIDSSPLLSQLLWTQCLLLRREG